MSDIFSNHNIKLITIYLSMSLSIIQSYALFLEKTTFILVLVILSYSSCLLIILVDHLRCPALLALLLLRIEHMASYIVVQLRLPASPVDHRSNVH
jgi:hypothetical protein